MEVYSRRSTSLCPGLKRRGAGLTAGFLKVEGFPKLHRASETECSEVRVKWESKISESWKVPLGITNQRAEAVIKS